MAVRRKGKGGLLNRKNVGKGITSNTENKTKEIIANKWNYDLNFIKEIKPSNMKPIRARQLIRRFHNLLKYKSILINKLNEGRNGKEFFNIEVNCEYLEDKIGLISEKLMNFYIEAKRKMIKELKINESLTDSKDLTESIMNFKRDLKPSKICQELGEIDGEIIKRGGLKVYQVASTLGQDGKRGGDSSKKLIEWLEELKIFNNNNDNNNNKPKPIALEIGSLSSKNLISTCKIFEKVVRIDLNSQEPELIKEIDFMKFEKNSNEEFNLISCSLVLNFVPNAKERGLMLLKIRDYLIMERGYLFLVLPLPCINNSRYINKEIMNLIMKNLGFKIMKYYESNKIVYYLFKFEKELMNNNFKIGKKEIIKGGKRNNFCIIIE